MNQRTIIVSVVMLVLSFVVLAGSIFAWVSLSEHARLESLVVQISNYDTKITLTISKNGAPAQIFNTKAEMNEYLSNSLPSDYFDFEISVKNLSSDKVSARIYFNSIESQTSNSNFNMLDVFFITGGVIIIDGISNQLPLNNPVTVIKHGQTLSDYRLSNLVDMQNTFYFINDMNVNENETVLIQFGLSFQTTTSDIGYQGGILSIGALHVIFDS